MTTILALDISSCSSGWCVIKDGQLQEDAYGLIAPSKKHTEGQKLTYFKQEMLKLIGRFSPDHICVEQIFCGINKISFKTLAEFRGVAVQTIYERTGQEPHSLMAIEHRKIMGVPSGKDEAFECIISSCGLKHLGFEFKKHNDVIDAISLGLAVHRVLNNLGNKAPVKSTAKPKPKKRKRRTKRARKKKG